MPLHINGKTASYAQVKRLYPGVMFPVRPNEADMKKRGHYVEPTPQPSHNPETQFVTPGALEQDGEGNWLQTWIVREFTPEELAGQRLNLLGPLEDARKDAEAEGVKINGIRYSGDPSNRQALDESLQFATALNATTFDGWKDSDGQFHADHPVADVQAAYEAIGYRRGALIALEGQYAAQLVAGEIDSIEGLSWEVS